MDFSKIYARYIRIEGTPPIISNGIQKCSVLIGLRLSLSLRLFSSNTKGSTESFSKKQRN